MTTFRLYNTLTKSVEDFVPIDPAGKRVTFYSCGPTVYDYAHIGNFRSFLNADMVRRTLELVGYEVRHVMNITDVGHMTDDSGDGGEDRMEVASRRLAEAKKSGRLPAGVDIDPGDPYAIAAFYADAFIEDGRTLGLKVAEEERAHPELMPRPTRYIPQMIKLVEALIARGHAYVARDGVVYFDVRSFPAYGRLSGNTLDALRAGEGGRVSESNQAMKRSPADFMLWKADPAHLMRWRSPWGEGYPGWHLECSVMAADLLAAADAAARGTAMIDLHSGGEDNIFPHHECEIAQSCSASGAPLFARYWFHTRHLVVEGEKMSKSLGNFFLVRDLLAKGATPAAIRLELVRTHYRVNANFTLQGLKDCQRQIDRWARAAAWLERHAGGATSPAPAGAASKATVGAAMNTIDHAATTRGSGPLGAALPEFTAALCDDLNVARAIAVLNEAVGAMAIDAPPRAGTTPAALAAELASLRTMNGVLGVLERNTVPVAAGDDPDAARIESLIASRAAARKARNFAEGDRVRDELLAMGVAIKDGPSGTSWSRIVK
ncbi:MAG: cysteine--tRNA ligase [Phycisphaerales bacterium]